MIGPVERSGASTSCLKNGGNVLSSISWYDTKLPPSIEKLSEITVPTTDPLPTSWIYAGVWRFKLAFMLFERISNQNALKIPAFGSMMQKAVLARIENTKLIISGAVPILQSLIIVEKIVENEVIAEVLEESRASIENGRSLTEPMKQHWAFPPFVTQMIVIGEETDSLDELGKVADFYEEEENSNRPIKVFNRTVNDRSFSRGR